MVTRPILGQWLIEALERLDGAGTVVEVCRDVWTHHEPDLRTSGDAFYTWQYDIRWSAEKLRKAGRIASVRDGGRSVWRLR